MGKVELERRSSLWSFDLRRILKSEILFFFFFEEEEEVLITACVGSSKNNPRESFLSGTPSAIWVLGIEFKSEGLLANALTF